MYQRGSHCKNFSRHLTLGSLRKYVEKLQIWLKFGKKYRALYMKTCFILLAGTRSATAQRTRGCASIARLSVCITLPAATSVRQPVKGNALLLFHGNGYANAP
jgi:hypothetical protein